MRGVFVTATWGLTRCLTAPSCKGKCSAAGSHHPAHSSPAESLSQRRRQPGSAWFCSDRRGDVSFWHCSPPLGPMLGGSKYQHTGPTRVLLVGLPQVPRPAQPGPCSRSCPSSFELCLRHVLWVEGGGLASSESEGRKNIHIWLRKRRASAATASNTGKISPRACSSSSTCPQPAVISQIPHGLLLLWYYTTEPHTGRGEREGVSPANPCPNPSSEEWSSLIFHLPSKQLLDSPGLFPGIWRRWCHLQTICFFWARGQASQIQVVCRSLLRFSC